MAGQVRLGVVHLAQGELESGEAVALAHAADPLDDVEGVQVASAHGFTSPFSRCHVVAVSLGSSMACCRKPSMRGISAQGQVGVGVGAVDVGADLDQLAHVAVGGEQSPHAGGRPAAARGA